MVRLDHVSLPVRDWRKSRDWYRDHLGFEVEFEIADRRTAAMRDDADLTIFLYEGEVIACPGIAFTIQVGDVEAIHRSLTAAGVPFVHPPMKVFWGYGAELRDPDGYSLRLWDQTSMPEKEGG
jgi:catechol 2,3-dioxygenase-like lactoylglutathione lyase family enzyme